MGASAKPRRRVIRVIPISHWTQQPSLDEAYESISSSNYSSSSDGSVESLVQRDAAEEGSDLPASPRESSYTNEERASQLFRFLLASTGHLYHKVFAYSSGLLHTFCACTVQLLHTLRCFPKQLQEVLGNVLSYFKTRKTIVLAITILVYLFCTFLTLVPELLCESPLRPSTLAICPDPPRHPEFTRLAIAQSKIEIVQQVGYETAKIPWLLLVSEARLRELAVVVELSDLPSGTELGRVIRECEKLTDKAGDNVLTLAARLTRTVDVIIFITKVTLDTLHKITNSPDGERGLLTRFTDRALGPFVTAMLSPEEMARNRFIAHIDTLNEEIDDTLLVAETTKRTLVSLSSRLEHVRIPGEDKKAITAGQWQITRKLSAIFGSNSEERDILKEKSKILHQVLDQKKVASDQVDDIRVLLSSLKAELADLRETAVKPGLAWDIGPLQVQKEHFRKTLETLDAGKREAAAATEEFNAKITGRRTKRMD